MWRAVTRDEWSQHRATLRGRVAFVPTMGALHEGHLELMRRARDHAHAVVVSVFVNPTQFGPGEDFERYPRPIEEDLRLCASVGVDGVFTPTVEAMYPVHVPPCAVSVPTLAADMEAAQRPGHFEGVCRVVMKLLQLVRPDVALFGLKDYQQFAVVSAMVADLCVPVEVVGVPTVREADGLAMSSRNRYLSAEARPRATALIKALRLAERLIVSQGEADPEPVRQAMRHALTAHGLRVDYAELRHPLTLSPVQAVTGEVVALVAARLDGVRLLDNLLIRPRAHP